MAEALLAETLGSEGEIGIPIATRAVCQPSTETGVARFIAGVARAAKSRWRSPVSSGATVLAYELVGNSREDSAGCEIARSKRRAVRKPGPLGQALDDARHTPAGETLPQIPVARRLFFANQGAFRKSDYAEIMNKVSALSLLSNAALAWNTVHIGQLAKGLEARGETVSRDTLAPVSPLVHHHIIPSGTYRFRPKQRP